MCMVCNALCGGCQPPRKKAVLCPECGTLSIFNIEITLPPVPRTCTKCGLDVTDLATPQTVHCLNSGLPCANPCGYHRKAPENGELVRCSRTTPPPVPCENGR